MDKPRAIFNYDDDDVDIIRNLDGSLIIEVCADYGDSYTGWGSTTKTIHMDAKQAKAFAIFVLGVSD